MNIKRTLLAAATTVAAGAIVIGTGGLAGAASPTAGGLPDVCSPTGNTTVVYIMPCTSDNPPFSALCQAPYTTNAAWNAITGAYCSPGGVNDGNTVIAAPAQPQAAAHRAVRHHVVRHHARRHVVRRYRSHR